MLLLETPDAASESGADPLMLPRRKSEIYRIFSGLKVFWRRSSLSFVRVRIRCRSVELIFPGIRKFIGPKVIWWWDSRWIIRRNPERIYECFWGGNRIFIGYLLVKMYFDDGRSMRSRPRGWELETEARDSSRIRVTRLRNRFKAMDWFARTISVLFYVCVCRLGSVSRWIFNRNGLIS